MSDTISSLISICNSPEITGINGEKFVDSFIKGFIAWIFISQDWEVLVLSKLKWDVRHVLPVDDIDLILDLLSRPAEMNAHVRKLSLAYISMCPLGMSSCASWSSSYNCNASDRGLYV